MVAKGAHSMMGRTPPVDDVTSDDGRSERRLNRKEESSKKRNPKQTMNC